MGSFQTVADRNVLATYGNGDERMLYGRMWHGGIIASCHGSPSRALRQGEAAEVCQHGTNPFPPRRLREVSKQPDAVRLQ
jgi:hypothetical protein